MELLNELLSNSDIPVFSAFLLGLITAISPCPMATNITAIAFIGKDIEDKRRVFLSGLVYTLGRTIAYTVLGVILFYGASAMKISEIFQGWGEKLLGPFLILFGIFMLDLINISLPGLGSITGKIGQKYSNKGFWEVLFIGIVFALAFCPYSGVLYFGMLIPMTVSSDAGLLLPPVFAIATGLPVLIFAYLLAFTVAGVGNMYNRMKVFEKWFRKIVGIIFIAVGLYYVYLFFVQ